jgi:hypothetical protein
MLLTVGTAAWSAATDTGPPHAITVSRPSRPSSPAAAVVPAPPASPTTTTTTPRLLTVSTTKLSVGDEVTVTGTGCRAGHWGEPVVQSDDEPFVFNPGNGGLYNDEEYLSSPSGDYAGGIVGHDGRWTATGTVPMIPPGSATLTGWCMPEEGDDGESIDFDYIPGLRVTVSTPFQLAVEQGTSVSPGSTLDVNLLGGTCGGVAGPLVDLYTGAQIKVVTATASSISGWQFALALPPGLMPGQYRLEADCVYSRGAVFGSYAPTTITVR